MNNVRRLRRLPAILALAITALVLTACSSRLGWGVLLWATDDPSMPSGTVLPVYIRSNIDRVWIVGLPDGLLTSSGLDKMELPLARLELVGSRAAAEARAAEFAPFAVMYAENLQVGLPVRAHPDNNARRVYRLREGEVMKVLGVSQRGVAPIGVTGEPLAGRWYRVLTEDGTVGYSFSYRLRVFEHRGGQLVVLESGEDDGSAAADLELLMSRNWVPESYVAMINSGRINLDELSRGWHFNPGRDTGVARVLGPGVNLSFSYLGIVPTGNRSWRFDGTGLTAQLRSDTFLTVQFTEGGGTRSLNFVSPPFNVGDVIAVERARRAGLFADILRYGPVFTSGNFGTIAFRPDGTFTGSGFDLLVPQHIPRAAQGQGTVAMDIFLSPALEASHGGAFTMRFQGSDGREAATLRSMYSIDGQGFRIELVPEASMDGLTVARRAASPMVMFFRPDSEIAGLAGTDLL